MGIDFSHREAHWSYSGFNSFRTKLAKEIGVNLDEMEGFSPIAKDWKKFDGDDIVLLLNHSDCDGDIAPEDCKKIALRLRELIKNWDDNDYDKIGGIELAEGMEEAAKLNERFCFC